MSDFDDKRKGTGTNEWSERTENIQRGCSHNCLYCYASSNAVRFKLRDRNDWEREELTKKAFIGYMKSGAVRVKRATREPAAVRVHGNTAVVTGVERVEATVEGKDKTVSSRYLHVWANEAQGWRLVARQATYLTENR